uniref:Uncharacterized protein n=1 Tax=Heliothis virescens TaxID=7102 RepID=A0A2A4J9R5_HELVI
MDMCIKYQSENMWKYVTRRIRDTCERSANHFDRCSTTVANGAAINNDEAIEGPPFRWIAFRGGCRPHQNESGANTTKWSFEFDHLDKNWKGAIPWANDKNWNHDKHAGPPHWFPFHHSEGNHSKWSWEHPDTAHKKVVPWEKVSNENHFNDDNSRGPPCKWFSFGKHGPPAANDMKWDFDQDKTLVGNVPVENVSNEETIVGPPCKWFGFRRPGHRRASAAPRRRAGSAGRHRRTQIPRRQHFRTTSQPCQHLELPAFTVLNKRTNYTNTKQALCRQY